MEVPVDDFERFFRERYRTLVRFIYQRVSDRELAEDLAAEAFTRALSKHDAGVTITMRWLIATARNLIGNEYQRRESDRERVRRVFVEDVVAAGDEGAFVAVEVRHAMTKLRPLDALALQLTYWDGLPAADAAAVMECTRGAFWARLTRARAALKRALADDSPRLGEAAVVEGSGAHG